MWVDGTRQPGDMMRCDLPLPPASKDGGRSAVGLLSAVGRDRTRGVSVFVLGVDRPALTVALARRDLTVAMWALGATVALVADGNAPPPCPALIETGDGARAIALLDAGADDVVLRSDSDDLVAARLAALVRRSRPGLVRVGDIAIDTVERQVSRHGRPLPLLPREYALLHFLACHAGTAVDHATLHQALWGRAFDPGTNVIAVHVSRLRAKLGSTGVSVVTDRGKGYRLVAVGQERG